MKNKDIRRRNLVRLAVWTFSWVGIKAFLVFGHKALWGGTVWVTSLMLFLDVLIGLGMVIAYRRLLLKLDELEKKIQLESMGLTLGLTLVVGLAYSAMDITNLIPWYADIGFLMQFIAVCYMVCIFINTPRYC